MTLLKIFAEVIRRYRQWQVWCFWRQIQTLTARRITKRIAPLAAEFQSRSICFVTMEWIQC